MRTLLQRMSPAERSAASARVAEGVRSEIERRGARVVLGFAPMATEPDWWTAVAGVRFGFPRILPDKSEGARLEFREARSLADLSTVSLGVREPRADARKLDPRDADLILVPGLAFDSAGGRLGRGGGYYDQLLAELPIEVRRLGVAYAGQLVDRVPMEGHDARVAGTIVDDATLWFK